MTRTVDDARALLALLGNSQWRSLHVRTEDAEIFIAKPGGADNPMRDAARHAPSPGNVDRPELLTILAPHVGTIVATVGAAAVVEAGQMLARLELLGEFIEIVSPQPGVVEAVFVRDGAFVEYDAPLLSILKEISS